MITVDRTRTIRWRDPAPAFEALGRMPGLDYLRALMETTDLKVSYFRPLGRETGRVTCEGSVLHPGRRTAAAEGRLVDADGRLCAHATCTCLVMEPTG